MILTRAAAPMLFDCLETISHDAGAGAGHDSYWLPDSVLPDIPRYEAALAALPEYLRTLFAIGDHYEGMILEKTSVDLANLSDVLEDFFEGDL